jgi:hypothetical protein
VRAPNRLLGGLSVAIAFTAIACGGGTAPPSRESSTTSAEAAPRVDLSTAGEIAGTVTFDGRAPTNARTEMHADPVCSRENTSPQSQETYNSIAAIGKVH